MKEAPEGPWAAKLRSELAAVELAAGRFDAAEALARLEAETLLAGPRKDRLAEVYHAFARRLLAPDDPIVKPDPAAAHELLTLARGLAKGEALRARLLLAMADARRAANDPPHAIEEYRAYLEEYPEGADRDAARLHLGDVAAGRRRPDRGAADLDRPGARPRRDGTAPRRPGAAPGRSSRSPGRTASPIPPTTRS